MIREVKKEGKKNFISSYWKVVAVVFITIIMTGGSTIYLIGNNFNSKYISDLENKNNFEIVREFVNSSSVIKDKFDNYVSNSTKGVLSIVVNNINKSDSFFFGILNALNQLIFKNSIANGIIILIGSVCTLFYFIFVGNVIKVGKNRFFLESRRYKKTKINRILFAYQDSDGNYKNIAKVMFKKNLYEFIWSFTIVGGIVKHYAYYFIPYILAENPSISSKDAFRLSIDMTRGYKWKMLLTDLSFILYYILGIITLNISNLIFMFPYKESVYAEIYMNIRKEYITDFRSNYEKLLLKDLDISSCDMEYPYINRINKKADLNKLEYNIWDIILLFFTYSFIGYVWEVVLHLFSDGTFVNRGTLYGPWLPIYGVGGVVTFLLFYKYRDKPTSVFFLSLITCGVIEYFSSWYMELLYHTKWWDYTGYLFNINGRVCLEGLIIFGFGCTSSIYILTPYFIGLYHKLSDKYIKIITTILIIFFSIDFVFYLIKPNQGAGISSPVSLVEFVNNVNI